MKNNYDYLRRELTHGMEPVLYYHGREYWISYDETKWYFMELGGEGSNSQKFDSGDDLLDNAKIDGKLLSEIWGDVILLGGSVASEVKIILILSGNNLDFDEITEKMGIQPTKTTETRIPETEFCFCEWYYIAFTKDEDKALSIGEKTAEFARIMAGKEEAVNMLKSGGMVRVALMIDGNPFINTANFVLSPDFCVFAHKINTPIVVNAYRVRGDGLRDILKNKYL